MANIYWAAIMCQVLLLSIFTNLILITTFWRWYYNSLQILTDGKTKAQRDLAMLPESHSLNKGWCQDSSKGGQSPELMLLTSKCPQLSHPSMKNQLEGLLQYRFLGHTFRISDSVALGEAWRLTFLAHDGDDAGPHIENHWLCFWPPEKTLAGTLSSSPYTLPVQKKSSMKASY